MISVGSHEEPEAQTFYYNPSPPVEFFARGVDVEVAWLGGARSLDREQRDTPCVGNLRADPRQASELTPFQLKSALYLTATNVVDQDG